MFMFILTSPNNYNICNENECKIQYLNTLGNIRRTTDINWNDYKNFEIRLTVRPNILNKNNNSLRKNIYCTVFARLQDNSEIIFFRLISRNQYTTREIVKILNQQLTQNSTPNIDIIFR